MADILSQEDIDSLLSSLGDDNSGDINVKSDSNFADLTNLDKYDLKKSVSLYDFRRPDRVSKDQLRMLQNVHENYIRAFSTTLTSMLRSLVEIELLSVDQLTYQEFIMSIPNPSVLHTFSLEPLQGLAILEMNLELVYIIIEKLFGGPGKSSMVSRELSSIETGMLQTLVKKALESYRDIWEHIIKFDVDIVSYESNPQFVQIIPSSEIVILVTFEVRLQNETSGMMSICLPYMLLEPVISQLSVQNWVSKKTISENFSKELLESISDRKLTLDVELGRQSLTIKDFLQLQNGDIITLDHKKTDDSNITVNNDIKYHGKLGTIGANRAVEIVEAIK